ncbi:hypothetical protein JMM81_10355 [Bacillus sp. V3B]|uniref:hypothetical protein n=1 Tax=Bacillus sp. V3B TaxID=2804915 RepID=UPI00210F0467|nr:hypothetical protein [Bacillus sp. V3B]MCQ6275363.1 hypothetical protein [Bacillus sp. V3B]
MLYISLTFLLLGIVITIVDQKNFIHLFSYFSNMVDVITLIALVPLLTLPVKLSGYAVSIEQLSMRRIKKSRQFFSFTQVLAFIAGSVIHMSSMNMTHTLVKESSVKMNIPDKFMGLAIIQGYSLSMLFSPLGAGFSQMVDYTGVKFTHAFLFGLGLSILGLILGQLLDRKRLNQIPFQLQHSQDENISYKYILWLCIPITIYVITIILLNETTHLSMIYLTSILSIPFSYVWSVLLKKRKGYFREVSSYIEKDLSNLFGTFALMLSAGFFIGVLESSSLFDYITEGLIWLANYLNPSLLVSIFMLIIILFSLMGMHPLVANIIVLHIVNPSTIGVHPVLWGGSLLVAMVIGVMVCPFNGTTSIISSLVGSTPLKVAKWNSVFGVYYFLLMSLIVFITVNLF